MKLVTRILQRYVFEIREIAITNLESFFEQRKFGDEISYGVHECLVRCVVRRRLDTDNKFVLQRMRQFVTGEQNLRILQQLTEIRIRNLSFNSNAAS